MPINQLKRLRSLARRGIGQLRMLSVPRREWDEMRILWRMHRHDMVELEELYRAFIFPDLPRNERRAELLQGLYGTTVGEGIHIIANLHAALAAPGDVCEFGCNEGHTSRLLASELLDIPGRRLWLFDSFEGLPAPSEKDRIIDDVANVGDPARYEGLMRAAEWQVRDKLAQVAFPDSRMRLVKGWLDQTLAGPDVPDQVAFAYVDVDFYEPIRDALAFLDRRMPPGGRIVVDDYGFFSEGAQLAVDEFVAARGGAFALRMPFHAAGKFCILERVH
jgi:hypothetical protein